MLRRVRYFSRKATSKASPDTIFALASAEGRAGVAVVRVSGPQADTCLQQLTGSRKLPEVRKAARRLLSDPRTKEKLDDALVLRFQEPKSFTGEDIVEFHLHGSRPVVAGVLDALSSVDSCRPAEAGEFTERAFDNNRMDLMQVEALADLLSAETEAQRRQALRQMSGDIANLLDQWRANLIACLAHAEAFIDFGDDEDDVTMEAYDKVVVKTQTLRDSIRAHLNDGRRGEILRSGIKVAILGAPNAGKSSLLNLLAQRPAAIVSPHAGTTRDIVEVPINIAGYPTTFSDTAGIRDTNDEIELEGVARAQQISSESDLRIIVIDSKTAECVDDRIMKLLNEKTIVILNKSDLLEEDQMTKAKSRVLNYASTRNINIRICELSCETGNGVDALLELVEVQMKELLSQGVGDSGAIITRARHRQHLTCCLESLENFLRDPYEFDIAAEELRLAIASLGRILGRVDVEDVLDVLFSDFCIGK